MENSNLPHFQSIPVENGYQLQMEHNGNTETIATVATEKDVENLVVLLTRLCQFEDELIQIRDHPNWPAIDMSDRAKTTLMYPFSHSDIEKPKRASRKR